MLNLKNSSFLFLVAFGLILGISLPNDVSASKIPDWVKNVFGWYSEDLISEDEVIAAIEFLIENNIVVIQNVSSDYFYDDLYFEMIPEDCFSWELYDPVDKMCYIECNTESECIEIENDISAKADALWADELLSQQYTSNYFLDETQITLLSTYNVDGNSIFLRDAPNVSDELEKWQSDKEKHTEIWNMFTMIIPKSIRSDIVEFSIYTDGSEGELAGVERNSIDSSKWTLLVDVIDAYPNGDLDKNELSYSLVHEYGHILTASASQMNIDSELIDYSKLSFYDDVDFEDLYQSKVDQCYPQYLTLDGCSKSNSYLNQFFQKYWSDIYPEFDAIQYIESDEQYFAAIDNFYEKYQDRFVTDYAATNPDEDIAESWTAFVLNKKPKGDLMFEEKILFFYEYPELVKIRETIRNRI